VLAPGGEAAACGALLPGRVAGIDTRAWLASGPDEVPRLLALADGAVMEAAADSPEDWATLASGPVTEASVAALTSLGDLVLVGAKGDVDVVSPAASRVERLPTRLPVEGPSVTALDDGCVLVAGGRGADPGGGAFLRTLAEAWLACPAEPAGAE
jgi:hypothetical protein